MKVKNKFSTVFFTIISVVFFCQPLYAADTPAGQDQINVRTGTPKRSGDSLFSYTVEWRIDDGMTHRGTGLFFIQGPGKSKPATDSMIAEKMVGSLNDGMVQQYPSLRGVVAENKDNQPEVFLANKAGFSFTTVTFRDYSNQKMSYDISGKDFSSEGVDLALDLVLAADVDYIEGFSTFKPDKNHQGSITVSVDNGQPVSISTNGKSTDQLEQELASALGEAVYSKLPLYPNLKDGDKRNFKPFDGGEIQLLNLRGKAITIDIDDSTLGVLTKFKFTDENVSKDVFNPLSFIYIFIFLVACYLIYLQLQARKSKSGLDEDANT